MGGTKDGHTIGALTESSRVGHALHSHFLTLDLLNKTIVANPDDRCVPTAWKGKQVFPNSSHPKVNRWETNTPSSVMHALEATRVYKHAWRGVGAFYRKGDHLQNFVTLNPPQEYKALKMHPHGDKWIVPKPVLIGKLVIEGFNKGTGAWNLFEHCREATEPNTLPKENPPSFQVDRECTLPSELDPTKRNMIELMRNGMKKMERRFFQAAIEHHEENSMKGEKSIYIYIYFTQPPLLQKFARI